MNRLMIYIEQNGVDSPYPAPHDTMTTVSCEYLIFLNNITETT